MRNKLLSAVIVLGSVLTAPPFTTAHHSLCAEHDHNKPFSLSGKLVSMEWSNPHVHMLLDVKDDKGNIQRWYFEAANSPAFLVRNGWSRDTLKSGDEVSVRGLLSKSGQKRGFLSEVMFKQMNLYTASGRC